MIFACRSFLPPKQPSAAFCCCSIYSENSSAPVASPAIASRPHCVPKFSFAVLYSAAPDTAWSCTCPLPGAACSNASCCWKTSYSMGFQLRRSCILNPRPEPKFDQEIYMKLPSTSVFRIRICALMRDLSQHRYLLQAKLSPMNLEGENNHF